MSDESSELMRFLTRFDVALKGFKGAAVSYVEVSAADWGILMKNDEFGHYVKKHTPKIYGRKESFGNIGGYEIRKGERLEVHPTEEEQENV